MIEPRNEDPMESPGNPAPGPTNSRDNSKFIGAVSLAFGVLTIATGFIPCMGFTSLGTGLIGVILSIYGIIYSRRHKSSITLCIVGLLLCILGMAVFIGFNWALARGNFGKM